MFKPLRRKITVIRSAAWITLAALGVAGGAVTWLRAQDQDPATFRVKVDMVVLSFTVTDQKGRYVNGLKPKDFRFLEDDIPQKPATFMEGNRAAAHTAERRDGSYRSCGWRVG